MAIDIIAPWLSPVKQALPGSILDNLKQRFPNGLVLGCATCFFLGDETYYYYSMERPTEMTFAPKDSSSAALMLNTIKHQVILKKDEPYLIQRYDDDGIYLCDTALKPFCFKFNRKNFGVRFDFKEF